MYGKTYWASDLLCICEMLAKWNHYDVLCICIMQKLRVFHIYHYTPKLHISTKHRICGPTS